MPLSSHASRRPIRVLPALLVPALLALGASACDKGDKKAQAKAEEPPPPKVKVELPPPPNFDEAKVEEKYPDGSWSIYGLRAKLDDNVKDGDAGKEITVKGYVQEIYVPPECPEGEICPPGKQPHFWITDKPDQQGKKRAMMVVNYRFSIPEWDAKRWKGQPEVIIEKGKRYTIKGMFKRFSDTGFADARGLFEFRAYKPLDPESGQELSEWVYPPGAAWHPMEIARQEEENRDLAEKAAKAAEQYKKRGKK